MDFQLRIGAYSRGRRVLACVLFSVQGTDLQSMFLRLFVPSRIWYSDSQYGRLRLALAVYKVFTKDV